MAIASQSAPAVVKHTSPMPSQTISLDGNDWLISADPNNAGRDGRWWTAPQPDAKHIRVPGSMQETLVGYHGVAWYWKDIKVPAYSNIPCRYMLRFWMVDYLADVWVNGKHVGHHEGGEDTFVLDVTDAVKPNGTNRVAVRVLNPTTQVIDGIEIGETPHRNKWAPISPGSDFNYGGLTDSVELLVTPVVRVSDLFVRPNPKTGEILIQTHLWNAGKTAVSGKVQFTVSPAASGSALGVTEVSKKVSPGDTVIEAKLKVLNPHLWNLNDPFLYRVSAKASFDSAKMFDEESTRCGFRDFRFENGFFRLNGRRVFLKSSHSGSDSPVGLRVPLNPDTLRKDILNCKVMGFNMIRFIAGVPRRFQLDLADEVGLMVYDECFADWGMGWNLSDSAKMGSKKMLDRYDADTKGMIRRDRNHPSVVIWGLLNENFGDAIFCHAVTCLPMVRSLDDSRVVLLNSGRFDNKTGTSLPDGMEVWCTETYLEPNILHNAANGPISFADSHWQAGQLSLHPGTGGEYAVLKWTSPKDGEYKLSAEFDGLAAKPTTSDVHVIVGAKSIFDDFINVNGKGNHTEFGQTLKLAKGATVDVAVGIGNKDPYSDTTGVKLVIKSDDGKVYDAVADFSFKKNPNGVWSYGVLPGDAKPDVSKFRVYAQRRFAGMTDAIGGVCNPGSEKWIDVLADKHPYQGVPHTMQIINNLRTINDRNLPMFISEYGVGSAVDLSLLARHYEELGRTDVEDARTYRDYLDRFMVDWQRWHLEDTFASPEEYFRQCLANMASQRMLGCNAIRSNPDVIGYSLTGTHDQGFSGEGLTTTFRDLKPGVVDAMFDGFYSLRWCLFAEPLNVYRNRTVHLEAVLSNEDVLKPGKYTARVQLIGPDYKRVVDKRVPVVIPEYTQGHEPSFALPVLSEDAVVDGIGGKYQFVVSLDSGGAASGGRMDLYVADPADMPKVKTDVVVWGDDPDLVDWLHVRGINAKSFGERSKSARNVILVSRTAPGGAEAWSELASEIARGSCAIFLCPEIFNTSDGEPGWLPMVKKGKLAQMEAWLYHKDEWAKAHPIFDGLPTGLMDYAFYRDIIRDKAWADQDVPAEVVAGAFNTARGYSAGLLVSVNNLCAGKFILNTLWLRENLDKVPWADKLVLNMLNYAARDMDKPVEALPADFDKTLASFGYMK